MISVVFPWRAGCPWRERAFDWVRDTYTTTHPDWEQVIGTCSDGPFNRAEAILDGAAKASGDRLVVADTDVWCDPADAVYYAGVCGWARPHNMIHRLSPESTERVYAGEDWRGLPLSDDNSQDRRPYKGNDTGTLVVIERALLEDVPPDRRFVGWGREDNAWGRALRMLHGAPWMGSLPLVHLWHPPQERPTRVRGSAGSERLWRRYRACKTPEQMRAVIEEAKR